MLAVLGRNRKLFHCILSLYHIQSAVVQNSQRWGSYALCKHVKYCASMQCIWAPPLTEPTLNRSLMLQHFKRSNATEICNGQFLPDCHVFFDPNKHSGKHNLKSHLKALSALALVQVLLKKNKKKKQMGPAKTLSATDVTSGDWLISSAQAEGVGGAFGETLKLKSIKTDRFINLCKEN